jgi:hypothetical protein
MTQYRFYRCLISHICKSHDYKITSFIPIWIRWLMHPCWHSSPFLCISKSKFGGNPVETESCYSNQENKKKIQNRLILNAPNIIQYIKAHFDPNDRKNLPLIHILTNNFTKKILIHTHTNNLMKIKYYPYLFYRVWYGSVNGQTTFKMENIII